MAGSSLVLLGSHPRPTRGVPRTAVPAVHGRIDPVPKTVDREQRRTEIVETFLALVAREGFEATTTRRLAAELGIATGALWYYFPNFDEVLVRAFRLVFERTNARIAERTADRSGLAALLAMIGQIHPTDKTTRDEALVVVAFWGRVASHAALGAHQAAVEAQWREGYRAHLAAAVAAGELDGGTPVAAIADVLLTLASGLQVELAVHADLAEVAHQWDIVGAVLGPWLTDRGAREFRAR